MACPEIINKNQRLFIMKNINLLLFFSVFLALYFVVPISVSGQQADQSSIWVTYDRMVESNQDQPKKIMLFMEADWCGVCKRMKREVFPDPAIQTLLNDHFYPVRIDIESDEEIQFSDERVTKIELSKQFGIRGTPTIIFLESDFSVIGSSVGFSDTEEFTNLLQFINGEEYRDSSFKEYLQNIQ